MNRLGNNGRKFVLSIHGWAVLLFMSQGRLPFRSDIFWIFKVLFSIPLGTLVGA